MRHSFWCIILLSVISVVPTWGQYKTGSNYDDLYDSETVVAFKKHVSFIASAAMEGRAAGSDGEKATAEYVTNVLKGYGVDILSGTSGDLFGIKKDNGDTLTSRNVVGFIQGYDKTLRKQYIVIGARMDNAGVGSITIDGVKHERLFYGANGNASGLAMMMELARMLSTNSLVLRRSVLLIGFGASADMNAGSWYFLNRAFSDVPSIDAMINLDMLGTGDSGLYAYSSSNADMNSIVTSLTNSLQPLKPSIVAQEPFPSDHRSFYDKGIPSMYFTTGAYPEYNTEKDTPSILNYDMMEKELEYIYNYSVALINGPKPIFNPSSQVKTKTVFMNNTYGFYDCDEKPMFLGSTDPATFLTKWVYHYQKYPSQAVKNGIQGRVMVSFVIDKSGEVRDVKVTRSVDPLLDDEAIRIVSASPKWRPGKVKGQRVNVELTIPIEFKLTKNKTIGIKK
jgi:TonB family protein